MNFWSCLKLCLPTKGLQYSKKVYSSRWVTNEGQGIHPKGTPDEDWGLGVCEVDPTLTTEKRLYIFLYTEVGRKGILSRSMFKSWNLCYYFVRSSLLLEVQNKVIDTLISHDVDDFPYFRYKNKIFTQMKLRRGFKLMRISKNPRVYFLR